MPLLSAYRRALWAALDDGGLYTVTATPSGTTVQLQPLSDGTPGVSASRYDAAWIYLASGSGANQQRRIIAGSFVAGTGEVGIQHAWSSPTAGDLVEVTHLFPCITQVGPQDSSYMDCINSALRRLWAPDRVSLAFAGTATASLTAWPWLDRPERLVGVLEPAPVSGYPPVPSNWRGPRLVLDGAAPVLQLNQPYTGTLTLEVRRPADTLINGAEGSGFTSEAQTALPAVEDVVCGALAEAYRILHNRMPGRPNGPYGEKHEAQEALFQQRAYFDRTQLATAPTQAREAA